MDTQERSDHFPARLKERCRDLAEKYGYNRDQLGRGFEAYAAHLFSQESGFQEILEDQDADDPDLSEVIIRHNDLGVDVVLEDSESRQLLIVQTKWLGKNTRYPNADLQAFLDLHTKLCDPDYIATGGDMAIDLLGSYRDKVRDGYTVCYRFVTNRPLVQTRRMLRIHEIAKERYERQRANITCEIFGQTELKELQAQVRSTQSGILRSIEFAVRGNDAVEFHEPKHSLICRIAGNVLTNLYNQHKQELFALNIRLPMTLNRVINRAIRDTAEDEPEEFFFYNNGVSAVCSRFEYEQDKNLVTADRFQIINGAQTVGAIAAAESTDSLSVLFRLTATEDDSGGPFTENIIRYNNTQNPIQISDFRANDKIQKFLATKLTERSAKGAASSFVYQPKRGKRTAGKGGPILTSDHLARIRYSFLYGPVLTYREPKRLFDTSDSGLYWRAFGDEGEPTDYWTQDQLDEATVAITLDHFFKKEGRVLRKELREAWKLEGRHSGASSGNQSYGEANYLYRLSRYMVGLVAVGLRLHLGTTFESYRELLSSSTRFRQITDDIVRDARRVVRFEVRSRIQTRAESQPDYNLARDDRTWVKLCSEMAEETTINLRNLE